VFEIPAVISELDTGLRASLIRLCIQHSRHGIVVEKITENRSL